MSDEQDTLELMLKLAALMELADRLAHEREGRKKNVFPFDHYFVVEGITVAETEAEVKRRGWFDFEWRECENETTGKPEWRAYRLPSRWRPTGSC